MIGQTILYLRNGHHKDIDDVRIANTERSIIVIVYFRTREFSLQIIDRVQSVVSVVGGYEYIILLIVMVNNK